MSKFREFYCVKCNSDYSSRLSYDVHRKNEHGISSEKFERMELMGKLDNIITEVNKLKQECRR